MYAQDGNLTPAPEAGSHLHSCYVAMHPFWGQLPSQLLESNHVWLPLQAVADALMHAINMTGKWYHTQSNDAVKHS